MKSVGKQLEEARLARNWTPELAARETKIKVDRVRDLEADDYTNFSSPAYARGFVRTYARALNLDEYKILRQLDNKLPEDDNASFANEGLPYVPEPSKKIRVSQESRTGIYIVLTLGCAVSLIIAFVLLEAYRAGELPRYFATTPSSDSTTNAASTNSAPVVDSETPPHAVAVDPNDISHSARALPVDPNSAPPAVPVAAPAAPAASVPANTNTAPVAASDTSEPAHAPRALPVDPASLTNTAAVPAPSTDPVPVAVPVSAAPAPSSAATVATSAPAPETTATSAPAVGMDTKTPPRALPVDPSELTGTPSNTTAVAGTAPSADAVAAGPAPDNAIDTRPTKKLLLVASRDSSVRVTALDGPRGEEVLYDGILPGGQSLAFEVHKFSVHVANPSAVNITLDGVNYDPGSTGDPSPASTSEAR